MITRDKGIRHRATELEALKAAGVATFVLTARGLTGQQNGAVLVAALPRMLRFLMGNRPPFIASVSASGHLTMIVRGHKPRSRRPRVSVRDR